MKIVDYVGMAFLILGCYFVLTTVLGLVRFKDIYMKFHIGSKCLTAGVVSLLTGAVLYGGSSAFSGKILLFTVFLVLSNPLSSHALGRAAYRSKNRPANLVRDDYKSRRGNA